MLLDVPFETTILEKSLESFLGVSFDSSLRIKGDLWMLIEIELDSWVLKDGIVVLDTGVGFDVIVKLDTWSLVPWDSHGVVGDDDTWVGVGVVGNDDTGVGRGLGNDDLFDG